MGAQNVMTSASIRFVFWLIPAKTTVRYRRSVHVESIKVSHVPCSEGGETYRFTFVSEKTELAKEGIPMPFGNRFWASNWPTGKSPLPGLLLYFTGTVRHKTALLLTSLPMPSVMSRLWLFWPLRPMSHIRSF